MHKSYFIKRHCCIEMTITLCLRHFEARLKDGWTLQRDNGPDALPCYDCVSNIPLPKS